MFIAILVSFPHGSSIKDFSAILLLRLCMRCIQMANLQPDRRELHLTVTSDTAIGFEEMLELALKELPRYTKVAADPGVINHGEISGTVGSYSFEVLRGNPDLCMQIRSMENDGFTRVDKSNSKSYVFAHEDERRKSISTYDMSTSDLPKRKSVSLSVDL